MTRTQEVYLEASRRAEEVISVLAYYTVEAWHALAQAARGQGVGESQVGAVDPGPATIMIGGLMTMVTILGMFMARRSLGSTPEPVNTRASKQKADEAVDVYLDGSSGSSNGATQPDARASGPSSDSNGASSGATDRSSGEDPWTTNTTAPSTSEDAASAQPRPEEAGGGPAGEKLVQVEHAHAEARTPATADRSDASANHAFARGCRAGQRVDVEDTEDVLRCLTEANLGTPSIVQSTPNLILVRLDDCRGCRRRTARERDGDGTEGCPFEAGFLEGAIGKVLEDGAVVRETACSRWGDEACDFEVWY